VLVAPPSAGFVVGRQQTDLDLLVRAVSHAAIFPALPGGCSPAEYATKIAAARDRVRPVGSQLSAGTTAR
jgi:hypothetical protein